MELRFDGEDFFAAPFPSEHRRTSTGHYPAERLPTARSSGYVRALLALTAEASAEDPEGRGGYATTAGIFLRTTAPVDPRSLPSVAGSVAADASVYLTLLEGPEAGRERHPLRVFSRPEGSPTGVTNLLAAVPVQGAPLVPARRYALVVTTRVRTVDGRALAVAPAVRALRDRAPVAGLSGDAERAYREALGTLDAAGARADAVAGLAVFRTRVPTARFAQLAARAARHVPRVVTAPTLRQTFEGFCVYEGALAVPTWQEGEAPFSATGGAWTSNEAPVREEPSRLVLTVPRRAMPPAGFPAVVFVRTGGGGDRPLVDRGVRAAPGAEPAAGTGPAREFAREGFAGASWDSVHGGPRNVTRGDEQFLVFNVANLRALRDNVRQSALEATVLDDVLASLALDTAGCEGLSAPGGRARFEVGTLALAGHSMGASIAPLAAAYEPRYRALVLSGAGGSWIENVLHKERPAPVRPFAETQLGYGALGASLADDDPILSMLQWGLESADVAPYLARVAQGAEGSPPRHVLMLQGIVDHYLLPPIANTMSLGLGLDLAGPSLDAAHPSLGRFDPFARHFPWSGRRALEGAVLGNRSLGGAAFTQVVRQYAEDGIEDGHEVAFQLEAPKRDYRCFLRGFARGAPAVPAHDATECPP